MRRIFAFITLVFSLLVVVVIGVPTIKNSINNGTDFNGGYNIVYHVTNNNGVEYRGDSKDDVMSKAADIANERLNTLNITNPEVAVVTDEDNGNYLSITIQDLPEDQLPTIRYALATNSEVTLRDTSGNLLCYGEDVFSDLTLNSSSTSVTLDVKVKDSSALEEATTDVANSYTEDDDGNAQVNLVMWIGYQEEYNDELKDELGFDGDNYNDISTNLYARFKILTALAIEEPLTDSFSCTANVEDENVTLMNKLLDQDSVQFVLTETSVNKVGSFYSENVPTLSIILGIIGILLICALFVVFYRFAGLASAISVVVYGVITLLSYNLFEGLFGLETIIALIIGVALSVDANIVFLERIKDELRKGKEISRAFDEGSKKSISTVLDANILVLLASLGLYLFGTQVIKSFSAVLIISEVIIILVVVFATRYLINLICHAKVPKDPTKWFGVKKEEISDINDYTRVEKKNILSKVDFTKNSKKKFSIASIVVLAGVVVGLFAKLIGGGIFNYPNNLSDGTRFYFTTFDKEFATEESTTKWFEDNFDLEPSKIVINVEDEKYEMNELTQIEELVVSAKEIEVFSNYELDYLENSSKRLNVYTVAVYFDKDITNGQLEAIDANFEDLADIFQNEDEEIDVLDMNYSSGDYSSFSGKQAILKGLEVIGIVCIIAFIYLAIRFSVSYSLAAISGLLISEAILYGILALLRIPVGVEAIALGLGLGIISLNTNAITFDRLRESINESNDVVWTKETRLSYYGKTVQETGYGHLFTAISTILVSLLIGFVAIKGAFTGIITIIAIASNVFVSLFLMPHIWTKFDTIVSVANSNIKQRRALRKPEKEDKDEVKEYVFFGIND